jgi:hypothetical protein
MATTQSAERKSTESVLIIVSKPAACARTAAVLAAMTDHVSTIRACIGACGSSVLITMISAGTWPQDRQRSR